MKTTNRDCSSENAMEKSTTGLLECNYLAVLEGETYSQNVKCTVREWTDDVNIKNKFWFRHTVYWLPRSLCTRRVGMDCEGISGWLEGILSCARPAPR